MISRFISKLTIVVGFVWLSVCHCLETIQEIQDHILYYESDLAKEKLFELFQSNSTQTHLGDLLYQYANLIYFGQNDSNNSLKLSYYYYKLAAFYGQQDALFMTSLFSNFRLDGSYNILQNLDRLFESTIKKYTDKKPIDSEDNTMLDDLTQIDLISIYQYVSERRNSSSLLDLYLSSQQKSFLSQLAIAHKYMHGRGVKIDCRTASLYLKDLGSTEYLEGGQLPYVSKIMRLDHQIYSISQDIFNFNLDPDKVKILENLKQYSLNYKKRNLEELFNLAQSYFYGINGVRRDFNRSFELYSSIYGEKNTSQNAYSYRAGSMVGLHYLRGLGVKKNYNQSFKIFSELAEEGETVAINGLGYLYYEGYGVKKDQRKAIAYFKKSAGFQDTNGIYNYGIIHMLPSTDTILRDKQIAHQYLNLAADKGHSLAQYALGLIYLDGVDFYQSCELSTLLMSKSMSRTASSHYQNSANYLYSTNDFRQSHLNYLISGYLGEDVSLQNAAIIADKYSNIYTDNDIDFNTLEEELKDDAVYQLLQEKKLIDIDMHELLYEDLLQMVQNKTTLNKLLKISHHTKRNSISGYVSYILLKTSIGQSGYSNLRLGDYFYYGINVKQNYEKAYQYYKLAAEKKEVGTNNDQLTYIQAQGFFNLAYMEQFGKGVPKNYQLAYQHFNQTLQIASNNIFATIILKMKFLEDILVIHEKEIQIKLIKTVISGIRYVYRENKLFLNIMSCMFFFITIICLYAKKLRIKHLNNL